MQLAHLFVHLLALARQVELFQSLLHMQFLFGVAACSILGCGTKGQLLLDVRGLVVNEAERVPRHPSSNEACEQAPGTQHLIYDRAFWCVGLHPVVATHLAR